MFRSVFLTCCAFVVLTPYLVIAATKNKGKIHEKIEHIGMMCARENILTREDLVHLKAKRVPHGPNSACFLACMMKQTGVMDKNGLIQKETVRRLAQSVDNDSEEMNMIDNYLNSCVHVNNEEVTDGEKGCERAMIAYKCMRKHASLFSFGL